MPRLRCLPLLLILATSAALAQTTVGQRLNTVERWISAPHVSGPAERFKLTPVAKDPAGTPGGGAALVATVTAAPLEKAGPAGYVELRWTAAKGEPALDLAGAKAVAFAYQVELSPRSELGVPFLRYAENWDKGFVGAAAPAAMVADGKWHTLTAPLEPYAAFPPDHPPVWNWTVNSLSLNFYLYAQAAGVASGAKVRFGDFRLVAKSPEEIARYQREQERIRTKAPGYLVLTPTVVNNAPPDLATDTFAAPNPKLHALFTQRGFEQGIAGYTPLLTLEYLRRFNLVVILDLPAPGANPTFDTMIEEKKRLLLQYVEEGGGLLVLRSPGWQFGKDIENTNAWLKPTGVEILSEQVVDEAHQYAPEFGWPLYWTGNVAPGPLTQGVAGLFYPPAVGAYTVYTDFASPVKVTPDWQVLVSGAETAKSLRTAKTGKEVPPTPGTYAAAPPLVAVRQYGKGRVCVWPVASSCLWQDGYHLRWGEGLTMDGEANGMKGSAAQLLGNLFAWLAEPSKGAFGGYVPPQIAAAPEAGFELMDWDKLKLEGAYMPRNFVGLIGARSALSVGKGQPAEFIAAAKAAGYDFIAFTEDLASLTKEEFDTLKAVCKASTDAGFPAYPGFQYVDESGNSWVTFSDQLIFPEAGWFSKDHPWRLYVNNPLFRACQYPPIILIKSHLNPEKPWYQGNYKGFAVYTYENGKLVDDSRDNYLKLAQMRFLVFPAAVHLVDAPEQVAAAKGQGFQSCTRWFDGRVIDSYGGDYLRYQGQYIWFRPSYVSEGPALEDNRILNFGTTDLALPGLERFRLHVRASSPAGLREVAVLDGDAAQPWRRYLAGGMPAFEQTIDGFHDREYNLIMAVTDAQGKRALGPMAWTQAQENSYGRCSDNFNTMPRGKWFGPSADLQNCRGIEDYLVGRNFPYCGLASWEGLAESAAPAIGYYPLIAGRFGTIVDTLVEDHYPAGIPYNPDRTDYPEQALPNQTMAGKVRYTFFTPWQDSTWVQMVQGEFTAKQDADLGKGFVFAQNGMPGAFQVSLSQPGGVLRKALDDKAGYVNGALPLNGYAAAYPQPFNGSVGAIALQEGLTALLFRGGGNATNPRMYLEPRKIKAGEKYTYEYLGVISQFNPPADDSFVTDVVGTLGIGGETAYKLTPTRGTVVSTRYVLRLQAEGNGFAGKVTEAKLPLQLPVFVTGLHPNWDAGVWYKGKNTLVLPEWIVDEVGQRYVVRREHPGQDQLLRFPVLPDGTGMLQIDTQIGAKDLYLGNLLTSDNLEVRLTLTDTRPGKASFVVHNPTDKAITCHVKPGPGFGLVGEFDKAVTVKAGESVEVKVG